MGAQKDFSSKACVTLPVSTIGNNSPGLNSHLHRATSDKIPQRMERIPKMNPRSVHGTTVDFGESIKQE